MRVRCFAIAGIAVLGVMGLCQDASAQAPAKVGYQGRLTRADGQAVTGPTSVKFALFAQATGGTALWSETQTLVLQDGAYSTFLGSVTPLALSVLDGTERWVEVRIGSEVLAPRHRIASVPYAMKAGVARDVAGGTVSASSLTVANGPLTVAGTTVVDASGALVGSGVPTGTVLPFAGSVAPAGWALCDGGAVSRTTEAALFAAIGTTYGAGDGSTTFNLPDARGRALVGAGQATGLSNRALGTAGGEEAHVLTVAEMPSHQHTYSRATAPSKLSACSSACGHFYDYGSANSGAVGGDAAHNTMPPFLVVNYIIKR